MRSKHDDKPSRSKRLPLSRIAVQLQRCRNCELHANGTHAVAGEGPASAIIVLIGEQPGDAEEKLGKPFVGPAGILLDKLLAVAGVNREQVYITNAVKHFNFEERGRLRLHKRPRAGHINACKPWLSAELSAIKPVAIVLLGATAAAALLGSSFRLTQQRGKLLESSLAPVMLATWHPSLALRAPEPQARSRIVSELTDDLRLVVRKVAELSGP